MKLCLKRRLMILLAVLLTAAGMSVFAAESTVVRVGWFDQPGYQEVDENGHPWGYNYEYLMHMAQYAGWKYEIVPVNSFKSCLDMLQAGELDLMGCLMYSKEREETLGLPRTSSGTVPTSLFVKEESAVAAYDFEAFDGMTVACRESNNPLDLMAYAKENGFSVELLYLDNVDAIEKAVKSGEADAGVLGGYLPGDDTRIVASFAPVPFYFAVAKENTELLRGLNKALDAIHLDKPFYEKELSSRYMPAVQGELHLTREEERFVESQEPIEVAYNSNWSPIEMTDPDTGEFSGVIADVFARISELTGLRFSYVSDMRPEEEGGALIAGFSGDFSSADVGGYSLTSSYLNLPMVSVRKVGAPFKEESEQRIAVLDNMYSKKNLSSFTQGELIFYPTSEECLEAVSSDEVDQAFMNAYSVDYLLGTARYDNLRSATLHGASYDISIAVRSDQEPELYSVLNKALGQISATELNSLILKHTIKSQEISIRTIVEQMPSDVVLFVAALLILLAIVLALLLLLRVRSNQKIRGLLYTDDLTGLLSARGFNERCRHRLDAAPEAQHFIVDFDINCFEEYNSINGYEAGDDLLKNIAELATRTLSPGEMGARIQADHYVFLLLGSDTDFIANRCRDLTLRLHKGLDNTSLLVSYGIYAVEDLRLDITAMRDCALLAKRTVKGNYDRFVAIYDSELHKRQLENASIVAQFRQALDAGELVPYYQPQYNMKTEEIVGAEALIRWIKPDGTMIMPDRFIGLLERSGLIGILDLFMFERVCKKIRSMSEEFGRVVPIAVNISRVHLYDITFVERLADIVKRHGVPPSAVEIELTETAFFDNQYEMIRVMESLRLAGFSVAIDDFGSGFSSLNMLKDMRFDVVKIDRAFLGTTSGTHRGELVVKSVLSLAQSLKLRTVAEGVETREQLDFLRQNGCDIAQGFYFSRPVPEKQFDDMLKKQFEQ